MLLSRHFESQPARLTEYHCNNYDEKTACDGRCNNHQAHLERFVNVAVATGIAVTFLELFNVIG